MIDLTQYMTRKELAGRLGVSEMTVDRYRKEGMPSMKGPGLRSAVWFDFDEVAQWLKVKGAANGVGKVDQANDKHVR